MPMFQFTRRVFIAAIAAIFLSVSCCPAQAPKDSGPEDSLLDRLLGIKPEGPNGGWLFVGSKANGENGIYFSISKDGYHWALVNDGKPVVRQSERGELMRDPFMQRAPDNSLRMVWTWSTGKPTGLAAVIGYSTSFDLLHWTKNRALPVTAAIPGALNASAPAIYYDPAKKDWLILWSSSVLSAGKTTPDDRIYSTTTTDFKQFTPARLFFDPGYNVADAIILNAGGTSAQYYLIFRDHSADPLQGRVLIAKGPAMDGPWSDIGAPISAAGSESPAAIRVDGGLLVYYHNARDPQYYGAAFTSDMKQWTDVSLRISFPAGVRHGSFIHITTDEYNIMHDFRLRFDSGLQK